MICLFPPIARRAAVIVFLSLFSADVAQAVPYYLSWGQLYKDVTPSESQVPHAIALDARGNVFVAGQQTFGSGQGIYVAKYDALDGHQVWFREVSPTGTNQFIANDIAVDSQGDCVITGSRNISGVGIDYYTRKLKAIDGTDAWPGGFKSYNGPNDGEDTALKVVCDHADNVIVTGRSVGANVNNSTGFDFATIKYAADDGQQLFIDRYSQTTSNLDDVPAGLAVDSSNNVYVGGTVMPSNGVSRMYIRKLKAADLTKLWDSPLIDTGTNGSNAEGGATALAVDASNAVVATGMARDAANHFGYYTVKFSSAGTELWHSLAGPFSQDTFGDPRPKPVGVSIGAGNAPIVTGTLLDANGNYVIRNVKYTSGGFMGGAAEFWEDPSIDTGAGFGDTVAREIAADNAGNAIVVGETENENGNTDLYVAKYDALTGQRVYAITFNGSTTSSADKGVDVAVDYFGNIAALGNLIAHKGGSPSAGSSQFGTFKLNRLIAPTGDALPDLIPGVPDNATVAVASPPALSDSGALATRLSFKTGTKVTPALMVDGFAAGGTTIPAVKGQPAPVAPGDSAANWASFSDPVIAPDGTYAFAGKISGPTNRASGVWSNLDGTLKLVMRQGSVIPVPGSTDKLASVMSLGLENDHLIALVKLAGSPSTNTALLHVNDTNVGTVLMRKGDTGLMINGIDHTVKGITIFSPPPQEAGDGRWQGNGGVVARVSAFQTADPTKKATAVVLITNAGSKSAFMYTGQTAAAPVSNATYSGFGFPATAFGTSRFTTKATLTPNPASSNAALIYSFIGVAFNAYAQKGSATGVVGLPAGVTYADFSDPLVNTNARVAFIATLKGSAADVKPTSNKAIVFGDPAATLASIARTGDAAPDTAGDPSTAKWTAFTALALPGGPNAGPIFVAKLNTPTNNTGLWSVASDGKVRRLLRTGDKLGNQTVKKFTLLKPVSTAASSPRSFDSAGSVAVSLNFTDGTTALMRIGIP